jgi:hypothetical protein
VAILVDFSCPSFGRLCLCVDFPGGLAQGCHFSTVLREVCVRGDYEARCSGSGSSGDCGGGSANSGPSPFALMHLLPVVLAYPGPLGRSLF